MPVPAYLLLRNKSYSGFRAAKFSSAPATQYTHTFFLDGRHFVKVVRPAKGLAQHDARQRQVEKTWCTCPWRCPPWPASTVAA